MDSTNLSQQSDEFLWKAYSHSYLLAQISKVEWRKDTIFLEINLGASFTINRIKQGNLPQEWIGNYGAKLFNKSSKQFEPDLIEKTFKQTLQFAENSGYPFATIYLDSVQIDSFGISACLHLEKKELIYFDSIDFGGDAKIQKRFLQNYSNIKPGSPYQQSSLKSLDSRLSELPYVQVARPMGVYFYGNKAKPYVYLNQRKASSFDGIIGFAPKSGQNNKFLLTGDLNLKLANLLGTGKNIELIYRGFLNNSQDLQFKFMWPYFLRSKLALDYTFKLMKFDTTWLEVYNDIGLQYRFAGNNYVKVFYQSQKLSLLNVDTNYVLFNKYLPAIHDVQNDIYGLAVRKSTLNYFLNPSKGFLIELDGGLGSKRIIRNNRINGLDLKENGIPYSIYDSIKMKSIQYKFTGNFSVFNKLASHFVLHTQLKAGIVANEKLFLNELFRIGGLKTLKGFDEQSIFASKYVIGNLELRYIFQQNSGFMLFWNGAWYKNEATSAQFSDMPWGIGAGMNLETGAGIFSLYYALGSQKSNSLEIQKAKIHFGLVNYF